MREDLYTNVLVINETLYVARSKYQVPYQLTFELLESSVLPYVTVIPIEESDLDGMKKYLLSYGVKTSDAIHLATMEKAGITRVASEDEGLDKATEIKRIWMTPQ